MLLDDQYLQEIGVADLPEDAKKEVVAGLEDNIQDSISIRVAEGLSDALVNEFSTLNDGTTEEVKAWLVKVMPYYATSPEFLQAKESRGINDDDFIREYAINKWMTMNIPDYSQIVAEVLESTKTEILAIKEKAVESSK